MNKLPGVSIKLISTHRLDKEKGRDLIIAWLNSPTGQQLLTGNGELQIEYDIYGDGTMRSEVEKLVQDYPDRIRYHGFIPLQTILSGPMHYDFVLMPSRFLETFGLSALDFAQFGVPTIGYKKGGLKPFIRDNLNIYNFPGASEQEQFNNAMASILFTRAQRKTGVEDQTESPIATTDKIQIVDKYSPRKWLQSFSSIIYPTHE